MIKILYYSDSSKIFGQDPPLHARVIKCTITHVHFHQMYHLSRELMFFNSNIIILQCFFDKVLSTVLWTKQSIREKILTFEKKVFGVT